MTRNRGKKALYEVMSKARARQESGKPLAKVHPKKTEERKPVVKPAKPKTEWRTKPRIAQFNAGRFEFSVPYQAAIAVGLVLVLMLLGSYRLGQNAVVPAQLAINESDKEGAGTDEVTAADQSRAGIEGPLTPAEYVPPSTEETPLAIQPIENDRPMVEETMPVEPSGKNAIVLAHSGRIVDLDPVVKHFAEHGIALEIVPLESGQYQLRTVKRYVRNPATPGTDGFEAKREIIRVGALYKGKAPTGLDTFAPRYFSDAYGKNVED